MPTRNTLIVAEKPSVAKTLAAWLAREYGTVATPIGRTHIVVGHFTISWQFGHLLENVEPHEYDPRYAKWNVTDLPIVPPIGGWKLKPRDEVDKKTGKKTGKPDPGNLEQIRTLKTLLTTATDVIGLGDPDQEGQLLQDEFLLWAGCKLPVMRLWLAATDDASIAKAWKAMKPNRDYEGYYWSALARSHADWLFGINGTRGCTVVSRANGGNALLSVGRVQTPTLALIVDLENRIRAFKSVNYFTPFIQLSSAPEFAASWSPDKDKDPRLDPEGRLLDSKIADAIATACEKAGSATVTSVKSTKGKEAPPLPFSLSALQSYLSRKYGIGVQDTLKYAQSLYEKKLASYPRVDSEYLPESQHAEAALIVADIRRAGVKALGVAPAKADPSIRSKAFNDKFCPVHHAIAPRPVTATQLAALSDLELLVWTEIAKRYLLQFFPAAEFLSSEIELTCAGESFRATGKVYTNRGWKDAFTSSEEEEEESSPSLPKVAKGDVIKLRAAGVDSTTTKAPKRFKEGTLIDAMKAVHKFVADPKLKAVLRENVGIGTEATRANVIGELFGRAFIVLDKKTKEIVPTELGEQLIDALPRQITAPDMTALWQQAMDDIRKTGESGYRAFITAQATWLADMVRDIPTWFAGKSLIDKSKKPALTVETTAFKCVKCGSTLNRIKGKFGWFFGCSDAVCKTTYKDVDGKPVEKAAAPTGKLTVDGVSTGDKCPKCTKGEMVTRVCGPHTKAPGKQFLACSNFFAKGKAKCEHSLWPK
ncbi:DNA topoisomerase [Burkholderia ambifaria]|uniref:DNA topoisomerase n=1 Tax=Burkholderia ambifaria TaxID=152480 RepID=UPI000F80439A|nr:DNA topoisomerase [Burkholderia ambifaria]